MPHTRPAISAAKTALVLSGGGARAAYQVGVLQALVTLRREHLGEGAPNPSVSYAAPRQAQSTPPL